jgi:hypothetical protein
MIRVIKGGMLPLALLVGLGLGAPAHAQSPNPNEADLQQPAAEEQSSGDPWYGYFAAAFFIGLSIFVVCKSARR